jgi:prepilin-type processing-associated H-X9-DG protein
MVEKKALCQDKMHQITDALLQYESDNGRFPPAYVADKDGKPLYSWRVLLLPNIGRSDLYEKFHLDEPWDSPHNRQLVDVNIGAYSCPVDLQSNRSRITGETNYVLVVGPHALSHGPDSVRGTDINDRSKAILLVEAADTGIHWAEPRDLNADGMSYRLNDPEYFSISSRHPKGANAAFCDGHVEFLNDSTDPEAIKTMTTIRGGDHKELQGKGSAAEDSGPGIGSY